MVALITGQTGLGQETIAKTLGEVGIPNLTINDALKVDGFCCAIVSPKNAEKIVRDNADTAFMVIYVNTTKEEDRKMIARTRLSEEAYQLFLKESDILKPICSDFASNYLMHNEIFSSEYDNYVATVPYTHSFYDLTLQDRGYRSLIEMVSFTKLMYDSLKKFVHKTIEAGCYDSNNTDSDHVMIHDEVNSKYHTISVDNLTAHLLGTNNPDFTALAHLYIIRTVDRLIY